MSKQYIYAIHGGDSDFYNVYMMYWRFIHTLILNSSRLSVEHLTKSFIVESFHKTLPLLLFSDAQLHGRDACALAQTERYLQLEEKNVYVGQQEIQDLIAKNNFDGTTYFYNHYTYLMVSSDLLKESMYIYTM